MSKNVDSPSKRSEKEDNVWLIDTDKFAEGPDNWSAEEREGWRLYLVETLPYRDIYALCRYSWKTDREDVIVEIGSVSIDPRISMESVNKIMRDNNVEEFSESQYEILESAYTNCLEETIRNATLDKGFEVFDHTMYVEVENWVEYLISKIEDIESKIENMRDRQENSDSGYYSEDEIQEYAKMENISDEQLDNLKLIENAVKRPHEDVLDYSKYCSFVGILEFNTLEPFQLRAIELVHNGVFYNNEAVAVVQSLLEEGYTQKDISEKLGKDESTVSKQVKVAKNLTERARWHSANVTMDGHL